MNEDRLGWIYSATNADELRRRYDAWAADYDSDMAGMDWLAPRAAAMSCIANAGRGAAVLDAGCGTGQVGVALREADAGTICGLDFSAGMLAKAAATGAYDELVQASLTEPLPFPLRRFDAVVSVGVFTFGHVPARALAGLGAVLRDGGTVTLTFRDDVYRDLGFADVIAGLEREQGWVLLERSEPAPLVSEQGDGVDMRVWCWRVRSPP